MGKARLDFHVFNLLASVSVCVYVYVCVFFSQANSSELSLSVAGTTLSLHLTDGHYSGES
jgi:hypothetical protein